MAYAQCGPPPQAFTYSNNFYKAQRRLYESTKSKAASLSLAFPVKGIPVQIGASGEAGDAEKGWEAIDEATAVQYVQKETSDRRASIVAECGYYMCLQGNGSTSVQPPLLTNPEPDEAALASVLYVRTGNEKPNAAARDEFVLKPQHGVDVIFRVRRPSEEEGTRITKLDFVAKKFAGVTAPVTFVALHSLEEQLPNAQIGCGTVNPRAQVECTSDTPTQFPKKMAAHDDWRDFPVSGGPIVDYSNNGNTYGKVTYSGTCQQGSSSRASAIVNFTFDATASGQCGRNGTNSGGAGGVNPEWRPTLSLPGVPARHKWVVKVSADIFAEHANSRCVIRADSDTLNLSIKGTTTRTFEMSPGDHLVSLVCTGDNPWQGCYGGPEYTWGTRTEHIAVTVAAERHDISPVQSATPRARLGKAENALTP